MNEIDYLRESRLIAIEFMLTHIYNIVMASAGAAAEIIDGVEREAIKGLSAQPVLGVDRLTPVERDHLSSEILTSIERLFEIARSKRTT